MYCKLSSPVSIDTIPTDITKIPVGIGTSIDVSIAGEDTLNILCVCEFSTWKLLYHDRTLKSLAKSFTIMGMNHKKPYTFFSVVLGTLGTNVEQTRIRGFYRKGAQFYGIDHSSYSNVR